VLRTIPWLILNCGRGLMVPQSIVRQVSKVKGD
jgi:hypothetical protein